MTAIATHVIVGLTSDDLEDSHLGNEDSQNGVPINRAHTDLVTFEPEIGKHWVIISIYCKATGADTTPKLRGYFYEAKQTEIATLLELDPPDFWGKSELIFRADKDGVTPIPTPDGQTERYLLAPLYIGSYTARFALEECEDGADLVVCIERVALEQLPTY